MWSKRSQTNKTRVFSLVFSLKKNSIHRVIHRKCG